MRSTILSYITFFVLTVFYSVAILVTPSTENNNNVGGYSFIIYGVYFLSILFSQYFLCFKSIKEKCTHVHALTPFYITFFPWMIIFGTIFIILKVMPEWKIPFANTFGSILFLVGVENKIVSDMVSEFIWLNITGLFVISVIASSITSQKCIYSLDQIQKNHAEYLNQLKGA